jgi:cell division protease FtsH
MNEAAIFAAKRGHATITQKDLVDAFEKVAIGPEKKSRKLIQREKEITSYHELGHAIVGYLCKESDKLHKISIVSRGSALGITWFLPEEERYTTGKKKFLDEICGLLGGRAAEHLVMGDISTGASNDIERASQIARNMAMRFGMGPDLGAVAYGEKQGSSSLGVDLGMSRNFSEETARKIDDFVRITIQEQYVRAEGFLKEHMDKLHKLHDVLMKKETMTVEEFIEIFEGRAPTKEEIAEVSADAVPAALETAVSDEDGAEEATEQE